MSFRSLIARTSALLHKRRLDAELDDDIRTHLELAEEDAIARGLSPEDARREARRRFGGVAQIKEEHRDRRAFAWLETLFRDFRYGLTSIRRTPGFSSVVVAVLALGIGGTVAMFSVLDAVLLKPLPFPDPDRIAGIWEAPSPGTSNATTAAQFLAWQRLAVDFEALAAEQPILAALNDKSGPRRLAGKLVTPEYFKVFGVAPFLGRTFTAQDNDPAAAREVILSYSTWQGNFGGDAGILRKEIVLDGISCQVIGVLHPSAFDRSETQFWKPLIFTNTELSSSIHFLTVYGRLKPGVSVGRATQEMQAIYASLLSDRLMDEDRQASMVVESLERILIGNDLQRSVIIAFGAVLLVLLIACANVANLLFSRGAARQTELAIRTALGAGRGRLTAHLLTECLALCIVGGTAGVGVALLLIRLANPILADALPFTANVTLDVRALLFAAIVVVGVALLTGILPATQASLGDPAGLLKISAPSSPIAQTRLRRAIVIGEVALSLILMCGALLLARSLAKLRQVETGVRIDNVVTTSLSLSEEKYATPEKAALFYAALASRLSAAPGVTRSGLSTVLPLLWISNGEGIILPGVEKQLLIRLKRVDPGYFGTFDIPVLQGRGINESDRQKTPLVMVINQALAKRLAETGGVTQPVGKVVRLTSAGYLGHQSLITAVEIVGVIRSERTTSPGSPDPPVVYVPLAQMPTPNVQVVIRTRPDMSSVMRSVRHIVGELDPNLPFGPVASMEQVRDSIFSGVSRPASLLAAFASIAVLLSAVGLYGVVSYSVSQRRRELGIRVALGARSGTVFSGVLGNALTMVGAGLAAGLVGVYALTRLLTSLLFEVSPLDPLSVTIACISMLAIGALAGFFPARRAARLDVMISLRDA